MLAVCVCAPLAGNRAITDLFTVKGKFQAPPLEAASEGRDVFIMFVRNSEARRKGSVLDYGFPVQLPANKASVNGVCGGARCN